MTTPRPSDLAAYQAARAALSAAIHRNGKDSDRALAAQIAPITPPPTKEELTRSYNWMIESLDFLSCSTLMEASD